MKTYIGRRTSKGCVVVVRHTHRNGVPLSSPVEVPLDPCLEIRSHSPTGLEWGYAGLGAAQLALAILVDVLGPRRGSRPELYQEFKAKVVAALPEKTWTLTSDQVLGYLTQIAREGVSAPVEGGD